MANVNYAKKVSMTNFVNLPLIFIVRQGHFNGFSVKTFMVRDRKTPKSLKCRDFFLRRGYLASLCTLCPHRGAKSRV